jgi:hypothetical protein
MLDDVVSKDAWASSIFGCYVKGTLLLDVRVGGKTLVFNHDGVVSGSGSNETVAVVLRSQYHLLMKQGGLTVTLMNIERHDGQIYSPRIVKLTTLPTI